MVGRNEPESIVTRKESKTHFFLLIMASAAVARSYIIPNTGTPSPAISDLVMLDKDRDCMSMIVRYHHKC